MTQHIFDLSDTSTNSITICPNCPHYVRNHNIRCLTHHWDHRLGHLCTITGVQPFQYIDNTSIHKLRLFHCGICNDSESIDAQSNYPEPLDPQEKWTKLVYNLVTTNFYMKATITLQTAKLRQLAILSPFANLPEGIIHNIAKFQIIVEPLFQPP